MLRCIAYIGYGQMRSELLEASEGERWHHFDAAKYSVLGFYNGLHR